METPLTVEALNERFYNDPLIGCRLSTDSIWLYINTLKLLGCEIERPKGKNNFCYRLLSHPFGLKLDDEAIETLARAKAYAETRFSIQEMLDLDLFFKEIIGDEARLEEFFARCRSHNYAAHQALIQQLTEWTALPAPPLLELTYFSASRGQVNCFLFVPHQLYYERGVLYLQGEHAEKEDLSILRVDRIQSAKIAENEPLRAQLANRADPPVVIYLLIPQEAFEPFNLHEEVIVRDEAPQPYLQLTIRSRDYFTLKQRLLERGQPFTVVSPLWFKAEMIETLQAMQRLYEDTVHERG